MAYQQHFLGSYLVEAGLITSRQVNAALSDQLLMQHMRFGDVLVAKGWIKQQTLDYFIAKIVEPDRQAAKQAEVQRRQQQIEATLQRCQTAQHQSHRSILRQFDRDVPSLDP